MLFKLFWKSQTNIILTGDPQAPQVALFLSVIILLSDVPVKMADRRHFWA